MDRQTRIELKLVDGSTYCRVQVSMDRQTRIELKLFRYVVGIPSTGLDGSPNSNRIETVAVISPP